MTNSELLCKQIGERFLCKDLVFENLYFFNDLNNKVEICDALFEYANNYLVIQIKERKTISDNEITENRWLDSVLNKALEQIESSIKIIQSGKQIEVNDSYHQKVLLNCFNRLIPIVVFSNKAIKEYKRVFERANYCVNVFSIEDFECLLSSMIHPFQFFEYLEFRVNYFMENITVPNLMLYDFENGFSISSIKSERDMIDSFNHAYFIESQSSQSDCEKLINIIRLFKQKMLSNDANYRKILNILQQIKPKDSIHFVERFEKTRDECVGGLFSYNKKLMMQLGEKKIALLFLSTGVEKFDQSMCEMMVYDYHVKTSCNSVLMMIFTAFKDKQFDVDWLLADFDNI